MMLRRAVRGRRNRHEDERENREHECLDEPDEKFERVEWKRQRKEQERHHEENYFAREDVAEKSERERKYLGNFADELQRANK
jgi:hypothetical protein